MTTFPIKSLRGVFSATSEDKQSETTPKSKAKFSPVISVRVNREERGKLERAAAGMSLSAYVRQQLLGDHVKLRKTRGKIPVKDHEALARVLGHLGRSDLALAVGSLLLACEEQRLPLSEEQQRALQAISEDVVFMRTHLVKALGLKSK